MNNFQDKLDGIFNINGDKHEFYNNITRKIYK